MLTRTLFRWLMSIVLACLALVGINLLLANAPAQARSAAALINCSGPIQACIDAANDGDTILIAAGRYTESLTLSKPVSLTGVSSDTTILHAVAGQRVLTVTGATITTSVVISGLTFTGGNLSGPEYCPKRCGGGIFITDTAHLIIQNVVFSNNVASEAGGGLYADSATVALNDSQFIRNTAGTSGGGAFVIGVVHLNSVQFISNASGSFAGGINIWDGPAIITNSLFADNVVTAYGGGLNFEGTNSLNMSNSQVIRNSSGVYGGGASIRADSTISIMNSRVERNTSQEYSAGLHTESDRLVLINTAVLSNSVLNPSLWGYAAGVSNLGTVEAVNSRFENNSGSRSDGGGLYGATLYLTNTDFISNSSEWGGGLWGGIVYMEGGRVERNTSTDQMGGGITAFDAYVSGTIIISNVAPGGGGVFAGGNELVLNHVRVENNRSADYGGGIWTDGRLIISDSQILSNTAAKGGGVSIHGSGPHEIHILNSIMADNTATDDGAGLYLNAPGQYDLIHVTIAGSTLITKPAIAVLSGTLNFTNTIIASHTIAISNTSGTVYEDYNLFFNNLTNTLGVTSDGHSLIGDPKFVDPLNGDYHLQFGSAAIDHGIDVGVYTDLDGNLRPIGLGFDIGAYEYATAIYTYLPLVFK